MAHRLTSGGSGAAPVPSRQTRPKKADSAKAKKHAPAREHPRPHPKKPAKKRTQDHPPAPTERLSSQLHRAYMHLQRASTCMSLLTGHSGDFLRLFLDRGMDYYLRAHSGRAQHPEQYAKASAELCRAVEHLALAGLSAQQRDAAAPVPPPAMGDATRFEAVMKRLRNQEPHLGSPFESRMKEAAIALLSRAEEAAVQRAAHVSEEFLRAADALSRAIEENPEA